MQLSLLLRSMKSVMRQRVLLECMSPTTMGCCACIGAGHASDMVFMELFLTAVQEIYHKNASRTSTIGLQVRTDPHIPFASTPHQADNCAKHTSMLKSLRLEGH